MGKRKNWISLKVSASGKRGSRIIITPEGSSAPMHRYMLYIQVSDSQPPESMIFALLDEGYKIDILGDIHEATVEVKKK